MKDLARFGRFLRVGAMVFGIGCEDPADCTLTAPLCDVRSVAIEPGDVVLSGVGQSIVLKPVARDEMGAPVELGIIPVSWVSSAPGVVAIDAAGKASAVSAGTSTITATSTLFPDSSRTTTVTVDLSAVPTQLVIITQPGSAALGAVLDPQPVIELRNANGQLVASGLAVSATKASGVGTLGGATSTNAVNGIATFANLNISSSAGVHSLRFSVQGLPAVVSADFTVTAPPPAGVIHFSSDWSTALGYSANALRDGTKWPNLAYWTGTGTPSTNARVVSIAAEGLSGFPVGMSNALKVSFSGNPRPVPDGSPGRLHVLNVDNRWPTPTVGQTLFHRFYLLNAIRNAATYPAGGGNHPFQGYEQAGSLNCTFNWAYKFGSNSNGKFDFQVAYFSNASTPAKGQWTIFGLSKFTAHMFEVAYTKIATDSFVVRVRVDGLDRSANLMGGDALNLKLSDSPVHYINEYCLKTLFVGNNDPNPPFTGGDPSLDFVYFAGVAVAVRANANDWIGPYSPP